MSIAKAIAEYVVMQGRTTSDSVEKAFQHLSSQTVRKAIQNASNQRLIHIESKGMGGRYGTYSPAMLCAPKPDQARQCVRPTRQRVASVWELAEPRPVPIPAIAGRQYSPLGAWDEGASA